MSSSSRFNLMHWKVLITRTNTEQVTLRGISPPGELLHHIVLQKPRIPVTVEEHDMHIHTKGMLVTSTCFAGAFFPPAQAG